MNKNVLGWFLIIFGGYLVIGNTIFSFLFNRIPFSGGGPFGEPEPISPSNFWQNWLSLYGAPTILIAGIGIFLIFLGISTLKKYKNEIKNHNLIHILK